MSEPEVTEIDFTPDVRGTIEATRSKTFAWRELLGELIDNAFDASASTVEIEIKGKELSVTDNGNGCGDFEKMLTMGRHTRQIGTRLGRYGVGLKDAAWWLKGPTRISSVHHNQKQTLLIDWDKLTKWCLQSPNRVPAETGDRGTRIRFEQIGRRFPDGKSLQEVIADIGYIYSPAIKNGQQVIFRKGREQILAKRYELPPLVDVIDTSIIVDGKRARVHVGIVPDGTPNPKPGINYTHGFRVILPYTALGCGGYGCARIAGWVVLEDGWKLDRNKYDVAEFKEELGEAVFGVIRDIVIKASSQAKDLKTTALAKSLTDAFRGLMSGIKGKRDPVKNCTGAVEPKNTGRRHRKYTKSQPGTSSLRANVGRLRIDFGPCEAGAIGRVDLDGPTIWLADNHPSVIRWKADDNQDALTTTAVFLFVQRDLDAGTQLLSIVRDGALAREASSIVGHIMAEQHEEHGLTLAAV